MNFSWLEQKCENMPAKSEVQGFSWLFFFFLILEVNVLFSDLRKKLIENTETCNEENSNRR